VITHPCSYNESWYGDNLHKINILLCINVHVIKPNYQQTQYSTVSFKENYIRSLSDAIKFVCLIHNLLTWG